MMTTEFASLKQPMCVEMVVGPNVETISDPPVIQQQSQTCHIPNGENCFGLPYEDHNYGAPLPSKFAGSPLSVFVNHGMNNGIPLNDNTSTTNNMCMKQNLSVQSHVRKNGEIKASGGSQKNSFHKKDNYPSESLGDVTRCICGFSHDDGYMICCDRCSVWQHIDCVNIDRNNIPETYLCDKCNPRELNKLEAMQLQTKKLNDYSIGSELSSGAESGDDKDHSRVTYTAVQSTPTSLLITSNRTSKRSDSIGTGKKRKRSKDDNKRPGKKTNTLERKRSRSISKGSLNEIGSDDQLGGFHWARKLNLRAIRSDKMNELEHKYLLNIRQLQSLHPFFDSLGGGINLFKEWNECYQEIDENVYTTELLQAVLSSSANTNAKEETVLVQLRNQLAKVHQLRSKVLAMEDIYISQPIVEVAGSYMLSSQTEAAKSGIFKRPYPHVFFYNGFDGLDVVVDSRIVGNVARYLRRSCCPNSEVRHVVEGNQLHLLVCSKDNISNGSEITIPFDFKYQNCLYDVACACEKFKDCPVYKFTDTRNHSLNSKQSTIKDSDSGRVSPLRLSISRIHEHINGYPNSDQDSQNAAEGDLLSNQQENQRKKSREDRKVEAYVRAFERLEKKEKRKEQLHQSLSSPTETKNASKENLASVSSPFCFDGAINTPLSSQPARRINRRRSTKGGRRTGKKTRLPSYEGVLSPSLSVENDSNQSMDIAPITPDVLSMTSIVEESKQTRVREESTDSCTNCELMLSPQTGETLESNYPDPQMENLPSPTYQTHIMTASTTTQSHSGLTTVDYTTSLKSSFMSPAIDQSDLMDSIDELPPLTIECVSQEPPTVVNTSSSSSSKITKTKTNTTDVPSGDNKQTDVSNTTQITLPPISSFRNWEFCPGVPSPLLRIGIGNLPRRKPTVSDMHIKKSWLRSAKEEGLMPDKSAEDTNTQQVSNKPNLAYKKRLLNTYNETSGETPNVSQDLVVGEAATISSTALPTPAQDTQPLATDPIAAVLPSMDCTSAPTASNTLPSSIDPCPPRVYPTIEYENLSDDDEDDDDVAQDSSLDVGAAGEENKMQFQQEAYFNSLHLNSDINVLPTPSSGINERGTLPKLAPSLEDGPASSKKKVSVQEYLKRTKEQRKSLSVEQTEAKPGPIITSGSTSSTSSVTSSPPPILVQTPTTSVASSAPSSLSQPSSSGSSVTTTPTSVADQPKELKEKDNTVTNKDKENKEKTPNESPKSKKSDNTSILNILTDPDSVKMLLKVLPLPSGSKSSATKEKSAVSNKSSADDNKKPTINEKGSTKPLSTDRKEGLKGKSTPTSIRPSVERSNSSPSFRNFPQSRHGGLPSGNPSKKIGGSQQSSPSSRQSTPGSNRKGFTSPVHASSPRLNRGHSGSSLNSHSPTPTIYDRRHRPDNSNRDSGGSCKSRHSSGASGDGGNNKSPKPTSTGDFLHQSSKHSASQEHKYSTTRAQESPQKAPYNTPDVPGQPIPSLARGPGTNNTNRVPQVVYSRRPSPPRLEGGSPQWDMHPRDPPSSRLLKDVPYSRQDPYYYSPRIPSPPPSSAPTDRNSRDKFYNNNRYAPPPPVPRPLRREDEHHSPSYYHHSSYYPPDHRGDRSSYYPSHDSRPPSPVPPRPGSDYYHRAGSYYPPDYRR